jgi:sigma-E factor negative regulatory protein RseC
MERLGIGRQRGYVRALSQKQLAIGDSVIIGVREDGHNCHVVTSPFE